MNDIDWAKVAEQMQAEGEELRSDATYKSNGSREQAILVICSLLLNRIAFSIKMGLK